MPRRREVPKRDILPDPKFGNIEVSKFVNTIMMSCLLYTSPSPRDRTRSRMPSSA